MRLLLIVLLSLITVPAFSSTGPSGFAVGFGDGLAGIDFSDGTTRTNVGVIYQGLEVGIHLNDFALMVTGDFMDIQGSLNDYVANGGIKLKWYFTEDFHVSGTMNLTRFERSAANGNVTSYTVQTGGSVGGIIGWDAYASQGNGPFRLSFNFGVRHYDFGAQNLIQGIASSESELNPHVVGIDFIGFVGLDWYL